MKKVVINKEDLRYNIEKIKKHAEKNGKDDNGKYAKIIAVVKGNGYGLDIVEYVKFLIDQGIDFFAVATVEEALKIRQAGIKQNLLMLSSTSIKEDVKLLVENNVILTIGSEESAIIANEIGQELDKKIRVHLKIDTGFGRYGFIYSEREKMIEAIKDKSNLKIEGTFTHFSISFYDEKYTKLQFKRFIDCIEVLKMNNINTGMLHVCNSSAFIKYPYMHLNAVRIGSAFLGRLSIPNELGLKKIGYLESQVSEIKTLPKGFNIGYSNTYKTKNKTEIAVIPCGYMDGINIQTGRDSFRIRDKLRYIVRDIKDFFKNQNKTIEIAGKQCKILGRIGTYHVSVDITEKNIKVGDKAIFNIYPGYIDSSIRREYQ